MTARPEFALELVSGSPVFSEFAIGNGMLADMRDDAFPTTLSSWSNTALALPAGSTHFGFVFSGQAQIECGAGSFTLTAGLYFSIPGEGRVSGAGQGIVIARHDYQGVFQIGGPVEQTGRLNYIDGCTDSLLIPPVLKGDACLNLLCFPPGIDQTFHTHPSMRVGMVISGSGHCRTANGNIPLVAGQVFIIHAHQLHAFSTPHEAMRVIAYHPDSDFGAAHQDHPMINRTMVDGISASRLTQIQTK